MVVTKDKHVNANANKNNMLGYNWDVIGIRLGGSGYGGKLISVSQYKNL